MKFDSKFTFEDHAWSSVVLFPVSLRELVCWGWWNVYYCGHLCVTSLLIRICSPNPCVLFSGVGVNRRMSSLAYYAPGVFGDQALLWSELVVAVSSTCVAGLSMLNRVNANSNHCLFSRLPSASSRVRYTRAAAAAHPFEFEVLRCRTSQFEKCFLPVLVRMWDDLPYTVFDTETLDEFKGAVNRWLLSWVAFSSVFFVAGACGVAKAIYKQLCFSLLGLCCWFLF